VMKTHKPAMSPIAILPLPVAILPISAEGMAPTQARLTLTASGSDIPCACALDQTRGPSVLEQNDCTIGDCLRAPH
jgi:hypothetical protein